MPLTFPQRLLRCLGLAQRRCLYCLTPFTPDAASREQTITATLLCRSCAPLFLPYGGQRCLRCALPLSGGISVVCGQCLNNPPAWQDIHAYGLYQGHLRNAILRFKFGGEFYLASLLGGCLHTMTNALPFPDALTPIPRHPQQLRRRGFNQAHEIAKILHRHTGIPLMADLLRRTNIHKPQTGLSAAERRRNVRHFFEAAPQVKGLKLWLVDDVMTTGVTLRAAVQALNAGGALETRVIVVARTPRDATKSWGDATLQELKRFDNGAG